MGPRDGSVTDTSPRHGGLRYVCPRYGGGLLPHCSAKPCSPHCDRGAVVQQPDACQSAPGQAQRHVRFGSSRNRALSAGRPSNRCRRRGSVVVLYRRKACGTGPVWQSDDRCGTPCVMAEVGRSKRAIVWRKSRYLPAISARAGRDRASCRTTTPDRNNRSRRGVVLTGLRARHAMAFMGGRQSRRRSRVRQLRGAWRSGTRATPRCRWSLRVHPKVEPVPPSRRLHSWLPIARGLRALRAAQRLGWLCCRVLKLIEPRPTSRRPHRSSTRADTCGKRAGRRDQSLAQERWSSG